MSILITTKDGWIISHFDFIKKIYKNSKHEENELAFDFLEKLFKINCQYIRDDQLLKVTNGILAEKEVNSSRKRKRKKKSEIDNEMKNQIDFVKQKFSVFFTESMRSEFFANSPGVDNNKQARSTAEEFFKNSFDEFREFSGANATDEALIKQIGEKNFIFPKRSTFYSCDVRKIGEKLNSGEEFDFILMDPPWWNKFVRRKRGKNEESGYRMMYNDDLMTIPIKKLLKSSGIVAVWCSASKNHQFDIRSKIFPNWGLKPIATWYWVKIIDSGYPICNFRLEAVKQPYELIIFGAKTADCDKKIADGKIIISVPSAAHSHKPPLTEIIEEFLPENPACLELFARYLLPDWTSCGFEVLKCQHLWLYT